MEWKTLLDSPWVLHALLLNKKQKQKKKNWCFFCLFYIYRWTWIPFFFYMDVHIEGAHQCSPSHFQFGQNLQTKQNWPKSQNCNYVPFCVYFFAYHENDDASAFSRRRLRLRSSVDDTDEVSYSGQQPLLPPPSFTLFTGTIGLL